MKYVGYGLIFVATMMIVSLSAQLLLGSNEAKAEDTMMSVSQSMQLVQEKPVLKSGIVTSKVENGETWLGIAPGTLIAGSGWYPCSGIPVIGSAEKIPTIDYVSVGMTQDVKDDIITVCRQ